jgi:hypothetical protein
MFNITVKIDVIKIYWWSCISPFVAELEMFRSTGNSRVDISIRYRDETFMFIEFYDSLH